MDRKRFAGFCCLAGIACAALLSSACHRPGDDTQQAPSSASKPAVEPSTPVVPSPGPAPADEPPARVLRAYVWECQDGQKITMHNLLPDRAVDLDMLDGTRRLSQTVSASGVRYADDTMVFWTKGSTATLERQGAGAVQCTERRSESLREDARARGVIYRATGNEPGWVLEVGPAGRLDWTTAYGQDHRVFEQATESLGPEPDTAVYAAGQGPGSIRVTIRQQPCTDDGDVTYAYAADVQSGNVLYRGCAVRLDDAR